MRRGLLLLAASAALLAAPAQAAPPVVAAQASPASGIAPLAVTLTATGDAAAYAWDLGDGTTAEGAVVRHVYTRPGTYTATVTATGATGETAQAQVVVEARARALTLGAPAAAGYRTAVRLGGRLEGAGAGVPVRVYRGRVFVTVARTRADGAWSARVRLSSPGPYHARARGVRSPERLVRVRPRLTVTLPAAVPVGSTLAVRATLQPRAAGTLLLRVTRGGKPGPERRLRGSARVDAGQQGALRIAVRLAARPGYVTLARTLTARVVLPELGLGDSGAAVLELERRLRELRYALPRVDAVYGRDTVEAVYAFQRLHGRFPTGRTDAALWRLLERASPPRPRVGGGPHIEVDKSRQVLLDVRGGQVVRALHVSTGATGNTPLGSWHVYRKVTGWDWVLWYPMYFLRGFAIHGYPEVPPYPASHGCVRVPMWIAPTLFAEHPFGTRVVVYA